MKIFFVFLLSVYLLNVSFAHAQDAAQLKQIEDQLKAGEDAKKQWEERSRRLTEEYENLRQQMITSAAAIQNREQQLQELELRLGSIQGEMQAKEIALKKRRKELAILLRSLLRLSAKPDIAILFSPEIRENSAEAAQLLASASADISARAASLRLEMMDLQNLVQRSQDQRQKIASENDKLAKEQKKLAELLEENKAARQEADQAQQEANAKLKKLASQAANLRDLLKEASKVTPFVGNPDALGTSEPEGIRAIAADGDGYRVPVKGQIISHFGETSNFFADSRGIVLATREKAEVIAPFDGKVLFAGPFRSYGQILIIEHRGGYHTILAGMTRIDVDTGQWLLAGEPIGSMGPISSATDLPKLYIEVRQGDQVIDPTKWLHVN